MNARKRPSPALVISLIALFIALGGTSYAAINSLPANSVGTKQLKNDAVTAGKLAYGQTLPSGKTETGAWGFGTRTDSSAGNFADPVFSYSIPLAAAIPVGHAIYVSGATATHCPGTGHADAGYLCVYQTLISWVSAPTNSNIFNAETGDGGAGMYGWGIDLEASHNGDWYAFGTYAITAP